METIYKKSQYIIENTAAEEQVYFYSTNTGGMVSVSTEKYEKFVELLNDSKKVAEPLKQRLIETGMLVPAEINEHQQVQYQVLKRNYDSSAYLELILMPTEQCNFRCVYCYEDFKKPVMSEAVQDAVIKYVAKELKHRRGLSVGWFGGEPLLALTVIKRLSEAFQQLCKEMKKPYHASITTNGYLLDLPTFEMLRKLGVHHFQITIDGIAQTHDAQRKLINGGPTFERIFKNLCDIRDKAKGRMWSISLRTNVTQPILKTIKEYIELIESNFQNDRRFIVMLRQMWTNNTDEADSIRCENDDYIDFLQKCSSANYGVSQDYYLTHAQGYMCYAAKPFSYVIGSDGDIYKCTVAFGDTTNRVGYMEKGKLHFDEQKIAKWIIPEYSKTQACTECSFYAACGGNPCPLKKDATACKNSYISTVAPNLKAFSKYAKKYYDVSDYIERTDLIEYNC